MRKLIALLLLTMLTIGSMVSAALGEEASGEGLRVQGEGAYLLDALSGQTIYMKNPDKPLAPASTTKIMTGLLAIENGNLNDTVTASATMLNNELVYGTMIYLTPGEKVSLRDLLYALLLNSANDAAVAIAEHIGDGDMQTFIDMMNQRAGEMGATQTHFVNPSGLTDAGQVTTARDLALITRVACQNTTFAEYVRTKSRTISRSDPEGMTLMVNSNKLLARDAAVDGVKPGYTSAAQNCLVASMTKDGRKLIGVILKSPGPEIYTDMQAMFEYGFSQFENVVYKPAGSVLGAMTVNEEEVELVIDRPIYMTQKLGEQNSALSLRVIPNDSVSLNSVREGQIVARVEVLDGSMVVDTLPLKSARTVFPSVLEASHSPLFTGFLFLGAVAVLLLAQRKYADWRGRGRGRRRRRGRGRGQVPFTGGRESN